MLLNGARANARKVRDAAAGLGSFYRAGRAQRWDAQRIRAYQDAKLRILVEHAFGTVPYYRALMDSAGLQPQDIRSVADLRHIPITTKQALRDAGYDACISSTYRGQQLHMQSTSGSSGIPFKAYREPAAERQRTGFLLRALAAAGYRLADPLLLVVEPADRPPPGWTRWRKLGFDQPADRLLAELNDHRPTVVFGYVSPIRQMAKLIRDTAAPAHRPKAVVTVSEGLDPESRTLIAETFGAAVFEIYGSAECGVMGWECSAHVGLHVAEDSVVVELLEGASDHSSRVIVTNLNVLAMPFLRYDTGDLAAAPPAGACTCGCGFARIGQLSGRETDGLQRTDGSFVPPFSLTNVIGGVPGIRRYQIVQDDVGLIRVRLEQTAGLSEETASRIEKGIKDVVRDDIRVVIETVATLEPPPGRKFRIVENRVRRA
jgi:phenylacetate-CoA ligase